MAFRDRLERVAQLDVPLDAWGLEVRRSLPPIVVAHVLHFLDRECLSKNSRLHRTVDDDAGAIGVAPRNLGGGDVATNQRKWRLQRLNVLERLDLSQQRDVEIRNSNRAHFAFLLQLLHRAPGCFDRSAARVVWPVKLIEIDAIDLEAPQ